jgi:hypothetical protein
MSFDEANFPDLPGTWTHVVFGDASEVVPVKNKIQTKNYSQNGDLAVVDQGSVLVGGYTNDASLAVATDLPVVVFGDHTRAIKYIDFPFAAGADGIKVLRPTKCFLPRLFFRFMQTLRLPDRGYARHFQHLRSSCIPVPPLSEQSRIADKLDAVLARVDACRERLDRVPAILKRFRQSVLAAATSGELTKDWRDAPQSETRIPHPDLPDECGTWATRDLPKGWRWASFGEAFIDQTDSTRKLAQKDYEPSGTFPVVDQGSELVGGFTSRAPLVSRAQPPVIVFGDHTRCVKWIDVAFVQGADGVKVLGPRKETLLAKYAYHALRACNLPDKGYSRHMKFMRATVFPRPPVDEQSEIIHRVETLFAYADRLEARYATARAQVERLTPALLAKAFRGELVPQDPNDEPAPVLLERIRAARASAPAKPKRGRATERNRQGEQTEVPVRDVRPSLARIAKPDIGNADQSADDESENRQSRGALT